MGNFTLASLVWHAIATKQDYKSFNFYITLPWLIWAKDLHLSDLIVLRVHCSKLMGFPSRSLNPLWECTTFSTTVGLNIFKGRTINDLGGAGKSGKKNSTATRSGKKTQRLVAKEKKTQHKFSARGSPQIINGPPLSIPETGQVK